MELKDLRELLTKRGRISRGARTIRGADNEYLRIEGEEVRDLVLDAVRFRKANGEINYLEISESQISGLHYRNLDADYFSINKSDTRNSSFENVSLYDFGISGGYLRNFKMIDCSFGLHLWNVANAKGLKRISTEIDELLPSGKRFVASPYVREMQGHAMIENCGGKDIEIVRPMDLSPMQFRATHEHVDQAAQQIEFSNYIAARQQEAQRLQEEQHRAQQRQPIERER